MTKNLKKKAFTLTELIVVIAIIGILAAVLIPSLTGYIKKSKESAATQEAASVFTVYQTWCLGVDEGSYGKTLIDGVTPPTAWPDTYTASTALKSFAYYYKNIANAKSITGSGPYTVDKFVLTSIEGTDVKAGFVMTASNEKVVTVKVATNGEVTYSVA